MKLISLKKRLCLCVVLVLLLQILLPACSSEESEPLYPPVRSAGKIVGTYISYTMTEAFEKADLVAHVRIKTWVEESQSNTLYIAEILDTYKGKAKKEIRLIQNGSSHGTEYPLYIPGNEMVLFMADMSSEAVYELYGEGTYYNPICSYQMMIHVIRDDEGVEYLYPAINNLYFIGEIDHLKIEDDVKTAELLENLQENDPIWEPITELDFVYKLKDVEKYLKKLK